ncbi:unnamed protein product [Orchesella dallaii]|uniref:Uncharacterized protein n=1 Tax=Orchesella dallaii TaxID=48710 RepID=A0ABP1RQ76_9HEXA
MAAFNYSFILFAKSLVLLAAFSNLESKVVKQTMEVYYFSGSPDGVYKEKILGINGKFPGPTIEADVGDTVEVTLINKIQDRQNTTLHWHGMHQRGSLFEDGTSQIAQCPLPYGSFQIYKFNVTQPGTYWYHSHVQSQYTEGLFGALIVHGQPEHYHHDGELTLTLSDWYHRTAHENERWYLSPESRGISPFPDSGLINGLGRYPCTFAQLQNRSCTIENQNRPVFNIQRNVTYRVRIINAGAVASYNFSIDGHLLETIEVDGIEAAKPIVVNLVSIAPGQRYSFLVRRSSNIDDDEGRYLVRATLRKESLSLIEGQNINEYPEALISDVTAVLNYVDEDLGQFHNLVKETTEMFSYREIVPPPVHHELGKNGQVVYLDEMDLSPLDGIPAPDYFDTEFSIHTAFVSDENGVRRASFNGTPFSLPHEKPLLISLLEEEPLPLHSFPLEISYGSVVQLVVNNPFGPHPLHLHGHHFWVVGAGEMHAGDYDPSINQLRVDGVKRDTVVVEQGSWVVIRFVADNPGIWTFHCHMDWHNLGGMALTFVEAADVLRKEVQVTEEAMRICSLHR